MAKTSTKRQQAIERPERERSGVLLGLALAGLVFLFGLIYALWP